MATSAPPLRILTVCTGNICRSPVAERLLERELDAIGMVARVRSAGTQGGGLRVPRPLIDVARQIGLEMGDHRSRRLDATSIEDEGADLVLAMSREHLYAVVSETPAAFRRSFTLIELSDFARTRPPGSADSVRELLVAAGQGRTAAGVLRSEADLDLDDPYGGPRRGYERMVAEVTGRIADIVRAIAPAPPAAPATGTPSAPMDRVADPGAGSGTMMGVNRISQRLAGIAPSATLAVDAKATAMKAAGEAVVGFGAGEPDFPTPAHIVEAAVEACRDPRTHRYSPAGGLPELKQAIADKTNRDSGYEVEAAQILVTNGGKHAVYTAFAALCDPGDEVLLPAPYWLSLIHISEPTRLGMLSRMPSSA